MVALVQYLTVVYPTEMTDLDIYCNSFKCRKRLKVRAWITSCSHAFCDEDGNNEFGKENDNKCPACKTSLPNKYDIVRVDLNPSQQFKSMVLAGLRPEVVIDIAQRSISFWNYQIFMEYVFQSQSSKHAQDAIAQLEQFYEKLVVKLKAQNAALKKDLQSQIQRGEELASQFNEKQREINAVQAKYESLRRSQLTLMKAKNEDADRRCEDVFIKSGKATIHPHRLMKDMMSAAGTDSIRALFREENLSGTPRLPPQSEFQGFNFNPIRDSPCDKKKRNGPLGNVFPHKRQRYIDQE